MYVCVREGEGERKIIFSNLLPLFSPLVSLLFSKALWSVEHFFFLLLRKMETLRLLAPGREAAEDFSLLLPPRLDLFSAIISFHLVFIFTAFLAWVALFDGDSFFPLNFVSSYYFLSPVSSDFLSLRHCFKEWKW